MKTAFGTVALMCLTLVASQESAFECPTDQTEAKTPFIYDTSPRHTDCPALWGAIPDWYNDAYRATCQRWLGGALPDGVESADVTECHKYDNGTLRYRARVCCPAVTSAVRCFSCVNATNQYECNYMGTVETCAAGEVCTQVFNYYGSGGKYCPRYISKGCTSECPNIEATNTETCQNYVDRPLCAHCYEEGKSFTNFETTTSNTYKYCGNDVCSPNPCRYGTCESDSNSTTGYTCTCRPYAWQDNNGICAYTTCNTDKPCENDAYCSYLNTAPYYSCCCKTGFTGVNCSDATSLCDSSNCQNGGTCYDHGVKGIRCLCPSGYAGDSCEINTQLTCPSNTTYEFTTRTTRTSTRTCSSWVYYESSMLNGCRSKKKKVPTATLR